MSSPTSPTPSPPTSRPRWRSGARSSRTPRSRRSNKTPRRQKDREDGMRSIIRALGLCAALAALAIAPANAAGYPDKAVKIIVPFAAGGPTDVMARLLAAKLGEKLGQTFYVENLPGAGGNIGTATVAKSAPDGH